MCRVARRSQARTLGEGEEVPSGAVDEDVDAAELLDGKFHRALCVLLGRRRGGRNTGVSSQTCRDFGGGPLSGSRIRGRRVAQTSWDRIRGVRRSGARARRRADVAGAALSVNLLRLELGDSLVDDGAAPPDDDDGRAVLPCAGTRHSLAMVQADSLRFVDSASFCYVRAVNEGRTAAQSKITRSPSCRVISKPMPDEPPVTRATCRQHGKSISRNDTV